MCGCERRRALTCPVLPPVWLQWLSSYTLPKCKWQPDNQRLNEATPRWKRAVSSSRPQQGSTVSRDLVDLPPSSKDGRHRNFAASVGQIRCSLLDTRTRPCVPVCKYRTHTHTYLLKKRRDSRVCVSGCERNKGERSSRKSLTPAKI